MNQANQADTSHSLLSVNKLCIDYFDGKKYRPTVKDVSFTIEPKQTVVLVGESGSGKSTIAQSIMGLLPHNGKIVSGSIRLNGEEISLWSNKRLQQIRGNIISLIPQDPVSSFNPIKTVGQQVSEILHIHTKQNKSAIKQQVIKLFDKVNLSQPELRYNQYPHELSGGMRQRALIAMAVALQPQLIIADEPTSALDVTVQKQILTLIEALKNEFNTAVLLVTHDLSIAANYGDKIIVLKQGNIEEQGDINQILTAPNTNYTKQLLQNIPSINQPLNRHHVKLDHANRQPPRNILTVQQLSKTFSVKTAQGKQSFNAVDNISFSVKAGSTHAIVGESGSGKTTTIKMILAIEKPTQGHILIDNSDITTLTGKALRTIRKKIQLVQQNPFTSLDPKQTIYQIIEEPLLNFDPIPKEMRHQQVLSIAEKVHLSAQILTQKPANLSGGQRQRVAIARALILMPDILVLDEAVSALDVTVQSEILKLLNELQQELGLTYLFISHDLAVVRLISDTLSVMKEGKIVEQGDCHELFSHPQHDYTKALLASIPTIQ